MFAAYIICVLLKKARGGRDKEPWQTATWKPSEVDWKPPDWQSHWQEQEYAPRAQAKAKLQRCFLCHELSFVRNREPQCDNEAAHSTNNFMLSALGNN